MFEDAKVITSKFLQLRDSLDREINNNKGYNQSIARVYGTSEDTLNIIALRNAFKELCELLHKLTINEDKGG